jgi:hypothetical protein
MGISIHTFYECQIRTVQVLHQAARQLHSRPLPELIKVQKVQREVEHLAADAAEAHEEAVRVVEPHNCAPA